jgi:hypothetical protein
LGNAGDMAGAQMAIRQGHIDVLAEVSKLSANGQTDAACQYLRQVYGPCLEIPLLREIMPVALISEAWELKRDGADLAAVEIILREAIAAGNSVWGLEHATIGRALADLAIVLQQQDKFAEAEQSARQALAMRRKLLGMEDRDTMDSAMFLIEVLTQQGKETEAGALRREFNLPVAAEATKHESK